MAKANLFVKVREGESIEKSLRHFRKMCEKTKIFSDIKRNLFYSKPSVIKKDKKKRAIKAQQKFVRSEKVNY
ncbi:MAG: 30S ribosomal protein S21 [Candidatus Kerfeldbacteria bacterium]